MSLRLRLTLWYTSVLAVMLLLFSAALYYLLTFTLLNGIDRELKATAEEVTQSVRMGMLFVLPETSLDVPELDIFATPGLYIQVFDAQSGQSIRSKTLGETALPLDKALLNSVLGGQSELQTMKVGGTRLRVFSEPLVIAGRTQGVVQVGTPLIGVDETQRLLVIIMVVGGVVATAISAGLGALLARAALRPIDQITNTALTISHTEDLSRRLETKGPLDEVGRLAATFNEMLSRLESLFHTQRRFIADVSHELRTPLTTIQGNVDLLCRDIVNDPEARGEVLDVIKGEVSRMSHLVADLLLLARADAGVQLKVEPVELDTLLLDVYRQARLMAKDVEVRLGHEDQALIQGDADRLRQLLLNLVDNAVKYTPAGGQVVMSLHRDADWVRLSVTDTGIGIPAKDLQAGPGGQPLIFERFYRADPARTGLRGGTGLGLSIASWIAQAHNGKITVESREGEGSTFTVWLAQSK